MPARQGGFEDLTRPKVVDLFAGCGGLSLGFHSAGYEIVAGVEIDPIAAQTHGANFHPGKPEHAQARSVTTSPKTLWKQLGMRRAPDIDVLVGGPPCQAFARVGRAKLRSESARRGGPKADRAWLKDPRVGLYRHYLKYVQELKPAALLMENVPDVLNHGGHNLMEDVCIRLEEVGYVARYALLNAAHYGVPQMRERAFLIAFRNDLETTPAFPPATHHQDLPPGYAGTRACALRPLSDLADHHYVEPPTASGKRPRTPTTEQALRGLPTIDARRLAKAGILRRGPRRLHAAECYPAGSSVRYYEKLMRMWPEFRSPNVTAHVIRHLPRDYPIFAKMAQGDQYPEAHRIAQKMLQQAMRRPEVGKADREELRKQIVPPYDPSKFPNKWRKLEANAPSRTLMAHLGKDSYSHIHYDSQQARTISVREAARLQSFPDGFAITGSMNHGFRQIGNAVPPLLAYALARSIGYQLGYALREDFRTRLGWLRSTETPAS